MSDNDSTQGKAFDPSGMTPQEILAEAQARGIELNGEQLDDIAGGAWDAPGSGGCPDCGSTDYKTYNIGHTMHFKCNNCGREWC